MEDGFHGDGGGWSAAELLPTMVTEISIQETCRHVKFGGYFK